MSIKSTAEVVRLTGITREKLYYLEEAGFITAKRTRRGSRELRHWRDGDVELIKRMWGHIKDGARIKAAYERAKKELHSVSAAYRAASQAEAPMMIAFANQKGGVGKTSVCFHVAGAFAEAGLRVLCVDLDQQGNLSSALIEDIYSTSGTITDLFLNEADINDLILPTKVDGVQLIAANLDFSSIDMRLAGDKYADEILQLKLRSVVGPFDVVLIDAPPSLGIGTRAALNAAHDLVIPVECQKWSVVGTRHLDAAVELVQSRSNPLLRLSGYLINKFKGSRTVEQQYREMLRRRHGHGMFETELGDYVAYTEGVALSQPITLYKPRSDEAEAVRRLSREVRQRYAARPVASASFVA